MDEIEMARRVAALTGLFLGYGQPATDDRLRFYANATKHVPLEVFEQACLNAAAMSRGSFPPGPGDIVAAALQLAPGEYTPGQGSSKPRWYRQMSRVEGVRRLPEEPASVQALPRDPPTAEVSER